MVPTFSYAVHLAVLERGPYQHRKVYKHVSAQKVDEGIPSCLVPLPCIRDHALEADQVIQTDHLKAFAQDLKPKDFDIIERLINAEVGKTYETAHEREHELKQKHSLEKNADDREEQPPENEPEWIKDGSLAL